MEWKYSEDNKSIIFDHNSDMYWKSQDNSFREEDGPVHIGRNQLVIDILLEHCSNIKTVCDIGCRLGVSLPLFEKLNIKATGVEISPRAVEYGKSLGRSVIKGDIHELSNIVDETFDAIFSIHSLEHCYDPNKVLEECYKVLNPNGCIIIRLPVQKDLTVQRNKDGIYGKLPPHYSVFTFEYLEELLLSNNFDVIYKEDWEKEVIMIGEKV